MGGYVEMMTAQMFGKTWIPKADLSGKTVVITGANGGIGIECAKHLVQLKVSNLILACRSLSKGEAAKLDILEATGGKDATYIQVWQLDLGSYQSILSFSARIRFDLQRLDIFIANAGVKLWDFETSEGLERNISINVVSTLLCVIGVLPKLRETARVHQIHTKLTILGTSYHLVAPSDQVDVPTNVELFEALNDPKTADMPQRYQLSKMMLHQCVGELAIRVSAAEDSAGHRVVINIVNPGACKTDLTVNNRAPLHERVAMSLSGWTAEKGSRPVVFAAVAGEETHGGYISECQLKQESAFVRSARGRRIQKRMWSDLMARFQRISPETVSFIQ